MNLSDSWQYIRSRPRWLFLPPVLIGLFILATAIVLAPEPQRSDDGPQLPVVRAEQLEAQAFQPVLTGFGEVRPVERWQAVAQVPGRISFRHEQLEQGASFQDGTLLMQIDPTDYQLVQAQAEAAHRRAQAQLSELEVRATDLTEALAIERRALTLADAEYDRRRALYERGQISRLELDAEERRLLQQRQSVQQLSGQQNQIPAQRRVLEAQRDEASARLMRADEDLARTELRMPFAGRIERVDVESGQFVPAGQPLLRATATAPVEVRMYVSPAQLWRRFPQLQGQADDPEALSQLQGLVSYDDGRRTLSWRGEVVRIDTALDPVYRMIPVDIRLSGQDVDRLPHSGLYVRVQIEGTPLAERIVIPRQTHRAGYVFVIDADDRLVRRQVEVAFEQKDQVVIEHGLGSGDLLLLTDLPFPVHGMPVEVRLTDEDGASLAPVQTAPDDGDGVIQP